MREAFFYNGVSTACEADYRRLASLKSKHGSWQAAWESLAPLKKPAIDIANSWKKMEDACITLVLQDEPGYPALLKEIPHPPFGIYIKGKLPKREPPVAIVGTRKASESSARLARTFAQEFAEAGLCVISGLALGIDAAAHSGALDGNGKTVAVLANGLDKIYPKLNEKLAERILDREGAIISEYPPGSPTLPYRFLERNRIVSGLSLGVAVIEAPHHSGSLATARFALEQNRDVFVVPGPAIHPNFKGSHALIRAGAELVTNSQEILEALGMELGHAPRANALFATSEESAILETLARSPDPLAVDKIIELTNLNAKTVNQTLSLLLIRNAIEETGNGFTLSS